MSDTTEILDAMRETFSGDNHAWSVSDMPDSEYHDGYGCSSSDIKLLAHNPQAWAYQQKHWRPDSPQMAFGRLTHTMVLEPHKFVEQYISVDATTRTTKMYKDAVKNNPDKAVVLKSEVQRAQAIQFAVFACKQIDFNEVREASMIEASGFWHEGDILCKFRPDLMAADALWDLKTTTDASPDAFQHQVMRYGYHTSAAWYLRGANKVFGNAPRRFFWIAVEKEAPHAVQVYEATTELLEAGLQVCKRGIANYRECQQTRTYPAYATQVLSMDLPAYLKPKYKETI